MSMNLSKMSGLTFLEAMFGACSTITSPIKPVRLGSVRCRAVYWYAQTFGAATPLQYLGQQVHVIGRKGNTLVIKFSDSCQRIKDSQSIVLDAL